MLSFNNNEDEIKNKSISDKDTIKKIIDSDKKNESSIKNIIEGGNKEIIKEENISYRNNVFMIDGEIITLMLLENYIKEEKDKNVIIRKYILDENNNIIESEFTMNIEMMIYLYNMIEDSEIMSDVKYEIIIKILTLLNTIIKADKIENKEMYRTYYNNFIIILEKYVMKKLIVIEGIINSATSKLTEISKIREEILVKLNNIK